MRFLLLLGAAGLAMGQTLPDGPGKDVTQRMCKGCHGIENVVRARRTKDKWTEVVDDMVSRGAKGTEDEVDLVIEYLSARFGPASAAVAKINVNKASAADLAAGLALSTSDAEAIVRYRTEKGAYKSIQDVIKVPGIDVKKVEAAKDRIDY